MPTTNLRARPLRLPPPLRGVVESVDDPSLLQPGTLEDGENLTPERAPRLATRGGSRVMLTLTNDAGSPVAVTSVLGCAAKAATGAVLISHSTATTKHYATAVTSDMAFAGANEAASRSAFGATWERATPARPVIASLFERLYVCDATVAYASRNPLAVIDAATPPGVSIPTYEFVAGGAGAASLRPYCIEEHANTLFVAGYGDEETGSGDDPALVRHSFLGRPPQDANGFDKDAYAIVGADGDRVTGMKKGKGILLVAKANEFYRISGYGRAYPGWNFAIEPVSNTQGFGVENPLAFEHAEGWWFGIGKEGPFRTDGVSVESLRGPRQRTWAGIDKLDQAWVRYHPERRLVLFGVHAVSGAPDSTAPWKMLAWDLVRDVWQPDWFLSGPTRIFCVTPIASTAVAAPTAAPSGLSTTGVTTTGWTANWTNGDVTAETEISVRDVTAAGSWTVVAVAAAAATTYAVTGKSLHNEYEWRARHRRGAVYSGYAGPLTAKTLLAAPIITTHNPSGGAIPSVPWFIDIQNPNQSTVTIVLQRDGVDWRSDPGQVFGTVTNLFLGFPGGTTRTYRARAVDASWTASPSAYSNSATATIDPLREA
jgi:hypothetical protein